MFKGFIVWPKDYTTKDYTETKLTITSRQDRLTRSGSQSESKSGHWIRFILPARGASHIIIHGIAQESITQLFYPMPLQ